MLFFNCLLSCDSFLILSKFPLQVNPFFALFRFFAYLLYKFPSCVQNTSKALITRFFTLWRYYFANNSYQNFYILPDGTIRYTHHGQVRAFKNVSVSIGSNLYDRRAGSHTYRISLSFSDKRNHRHIYAVVSAGQHLASFH